MPRRWMRSLGTPTLSRQMDSASSSSKKTVTHSRSGSSPKPPSSAESVSSFQANGMTSALK